MVNNAAMQFADRAFLAHESLSSLKAILPASTLVWVILCFFQSVVGYSGVFVSQYFGAGDNRRAAESYKAGLAIAFLSGLLMVFFLPFGDWIFSLTAADAVTARHESAYYNIAVLGGVFVFGQMAASAYFTGLGHTRIVFWVNLIGNLMNVALDPLFIFTFGLGMAGAAWATVISLAMQFFVLAYYAQRSLPKEAKNFRLDSSLLRGTLRYGIPSGGYEILNMLSFTIFVFVTGTVEGTVDFAVSNACFTVNYLLFAPMSGFAIGAQTLVGQRLGAQDQDGARRMLRETMLLALGLLAIAVVVVFALNYPILELFAPSQAELNFKFHSLGRVLFALMSAWMLFDAADIIYSGALKGAGDTRFVFRWMFLCSFIIWLPLVFYVKYCQGTMVELWTTMIVYVLICIVGNAWRWHRGRWARNRLV